MASVGKPLPWKLREAIQQMRLDGCTYREISGVLKVSTRTVLKYSRGKCTTKPLDGGSAPLD